ncbi:MAG: DUF1566 domain-containing protein [Desulfohalobiaceae bacterium]
MPKNFLQTDLKRCFDSLGQELACQGTLQDGELQLGERIPQPRFLAASSKGLVLDQTTGLYWLKSSDLFQFPLSWEEALQAVQALNQEAYLGRTDWRLPNRRELRSLICHGASKPALEAGHPFQGLQQTWYWTSTSSAMYPAYAWYVHFAGGRMFWGAKDNFYMLWPVCGSSQVLAATGQISCFNTRGREIEPQGQGQDGELQMGLPWPQPRFQELEQGIWDRLTDLVWARTADLAGAMNWEQALQAINELNPGLDPEGWHLPNINELESLVDAHEHTPALTSGHPFLDVQEVYWSSTSSMFEPDWGLALYMHKGAVGVGHKPGAEFYVWPVRCV